MKRITQKAAAFLAVAALCLSLSACSESASSEAVDSSSEADSSSEVVEEVFASFGKAESFDYEGFDLSSDLTELGLWDGIAALDYVTLPDDFASITIATEDVTPTDEEVQAEIDEILSNFSYEETITDRTAASGDIVNIDFVGRVDGVVFSGGSAEGEELVLGSALYIDGFETQIEGHSTGETFDITVTFPEDYGDATDSEGTTITLSNKQAVFTVTLNEIRQTVTPELTDDFVMENLYDLTGFETADEVVEQLTMEIYNAYKDWYIEYYLLQNSVISEIPDVILNYQVCQCLSYYTALASGYGLTLEEFCLYNVGVQSVDTLLVLLEETIIEYAEVALVQQAVAEQLEIGVTDELMELYADYYADDAANYNYVAMNALINLVKETLRNGAEMI